MEKGLNCYPLPNSLLPWPLGDSDWVCTMTLGLYCDKMSSSVIDLQFLESRLSHLVMRYTAWAAHPSCSA